MKKNIVYLMLASLLLFTGCADYLDQDPEDLNSMDKIFSSKIETTKWYNRIYSDDFMVQEMHYSGQIPYFWCTDESAYILESHVRNIAEGKMSPDNYYGYTGSYNLYFFVRYYQAIRHCNLFLENVDKCAELGEIDRRTMRAEARFMRAYYHYLLLRLYGPIPIVETSRSADQIGASQARNTLGECVLGLRERHARRPRREIHAGAPHHRCRPGHPVAHAADGRQPALQRQFGLQELDEPRRHGAHAPDL